MIYAIVRIWQTYSEWHDLVRPEDITLTEEHIGRCISAEIAVYQAEYRMRHKNGHWARVFDKGRVIPTLRSWTRTISG